jgi:hypothetical protein
MFNLKLLTQTLALMLLYICSSTAVVRAQTATKIVTKTVTTTETIYDDGTVTIAIATDSVTVVPQATEVAKAKSTKRDIVVDPFIGNGVLGHFTWGLGVASGVDLTSHDMTMLEISGFAGYKGSWMQFAGFGASIVSVMNNSSRSYPLFGMLRTSFTPEHKQCFMEVRLGAVLNKMENAAADTGLYGSLGLGVTLAHSRKFSSHLVLRGIFQTLKRQERYDGSLINYDLGYASIGIGCAF